eukprot:CAMPEP_0185825480 /NCGR_PEP_ID=MMETSP1322-20130828/31069_1 /TAXON_ID=265543 /ORGANISM="Minutocellus polymorphus, Strain RCC2270" /LENGTH=224 /DNA_ID=CAMNT_0028523205 /DNA_START=113 /DNA_END=787 /DNA_ORIENTATION=-
MDVFARTPVGKEFFRRLWLASDCCFCAELHFSSSCFVDLVTSDIFRRAVVDFCRTENVFVCADGVDSISRSLEHPDSFGSIVGVECLEERCVLMNSLRSVVYALDNVFFVRRGSSLFRVRRSGNDIAWRGSLIPLLSSCDSFRDVFRHRRFAGFVRSLSFKPHGPGAAAAGRIEASVLHFISTFSADEQDDQVAALDVFHRLDVSSMLLFDQRQTQMLFRIMKD